MSSSRLKILAANCLRNAGGDFITLGTFSVVGTDANGLPIPVSDSAGGQYTSTPAVRTINNGSIQGPDLLIANPASSTPLNYRVQVRIVDQSGLVYTTTIYSNCPVTDDGSGNWDFSKMKTGAGNPNSLVIPGDSGASAYQLAGGDAVFGSVSNWLASLKGAPGDVSSQTLSVAVSPLAKYYDHQTIGETDFTPNGAPVIPSCIFSPSALTQGGDLESVSIFLGNPSDASTPAAGSSVQFLVGTLSGINLTITDEFSCTVKGRGLNTFMAGTDFPARKIVAGALIGYTTDASQPIYFSGSGPGILSTSMAPGAIGTTFAVQTQAGKGANVSATARFATSTARVPLPDAIASQISGAISTFAPTVKDQVTTATAPLFNYYDVETIGTTSLIQNGSPVPSSLLALDQFGSDGDLASISILLGNPGDSTSPPAGTTIQFIIGSLSGFNFTLTDTFTCQAKGNGLNTFVAGTDFSSRSVAAGSVIGYVTTAAMPVWFSGNGQGCWFTSSIIATIGSVTAMQNLAGKGINISARLQLPSSSKQVPTPDSITEQISQASGRGVNANRTTLYDVTYGSQIPTGAANAGGWTANNGLISPSSGQGYGSTLTLQAPYDVEKRTVRVLFEVLVSGTVVGVGSINEANETDPSFGSLITIDSIAETLNICNKFVPPANPGVLSSAPLGFAITTGQKYWLTITVNQRELTATLADPVTAKVSTVHVGNNASDTGVNRPAYGLLQDYLAFVGIAGQFNIHRAIISADAVKPRAYIAGDSITYGLGVSLASRWADQLATAIGTSAIVSGRSGDTSINVVQKMTTEASLLRPDVVVVLIGTNDAHGNVPLAQYTANLTSILSTARKFAQRVVLGIPPVAGGGYITPANYTAYVGAVMNAGADAVLRFDLATSVNNDGVTQNAPLFQGDLLHPNATGHAAMFARVVADAPWLLD